MVPTPKYVTSMILEPRNVGSMPHFRWFRTALRLILTGPAHFGVAVVVLAGFSTLVGSTIDYGAEWILPVPLATLTVAFMPLSFLATLLIARSVDRGVPEALRALRTCRVIGWKFLLPAFYSAIAVVGFAVGIGHGAEILDASGRLDEAFEKVPPSAVVSLLAVWTIAVITAQETFELPLWAFTPLNWSDVAMASRRGVSAQSPAKGFLIGNILATGTAMVLSATFFSTPFAAALVPLVQVVWLTYLYVAYCDVFEGRKDLGKERKQVAAYRAKPLES